MKNSIESMSWATMMEKLRVSPGAVARTLLRNLDKFDPLSPREEATIIHAIENAGLDVNRMLAHLSRNAIKEILKSC